MITEKHDDIDGEAGVEGGDLLRLVADRVAGRCRVEVATTLRVDLRERVLPAGEKSTLN